MMVEVEVTVGVSVGVLDGVKVGVGSCTIPKVVSKSTIFVVASATLPKTIIKATTAANIAPRGLSSTALLRRSKRLSCSEEDISLKFL